jgi:hypothetical protein
MVLTDGFYKGCIPHVTHRDKPMVFTAVTHRDKPMIFIALGSSMVGVAVPVMSMYLRLYPKAVT